MRYLPSVLRHQRTNTSGTNDARTASHPAVRQRLVLALRGLDKAGISSGWVAVFAVAGSSTSEQLGPLCRLPLRDDERCQECRVGLRRLASIDRSQHRKAQRFGAPDCGSAP